MIKHNVFLKNQVFILKERLSAHRRSSRGDDARGRGIDYMAGPGPVATKHLRTCVDVRDAYGLEDLAAARRGRLIKSTRPDLGKLINCFSSFRSVGAVCVHAKRTELESALPCDAFVREEKESHLLSLRRKAESLRSSASHAAAPGVEQPRMRRALD